MIVVGLSPLRLVSLWTLRLAWRVLRRVPGTVLAMAAVAAYANGAEWPAVVTLALAALFLSRRRPRRPRRSWPPRVHRRRPRREIEDQATTLYRYYDRAWQDEDAVLLYVGITNNPMRRMSQHSAKEWAPLARSWYPVVYPDRATAEAAERRAIRTERPAYNIAHVR